MSTLAEVEKRRADRREAADKAREAQEVTDLEAIEALEAGGTMLHTMTAPRHVPGVVMKIGFRAPTAGEYKRYLDTIGAAQSRNDAKARRGAQEMLAASCLVYPAKEEQASLLAEFPGTLISLAIEAAKVAELRAEDEKNG